MNIFDYSDSALSSFATEIEHKLLAVSEGNIAVKILRVSLQRYTIFDLQMIGNNIRFEVEKLPNPYKSLFKPYAFDLLENYHRIITNPNVIGKITNHERWKQYWSTLSSSLFTDEYSNRVSTYGIGKPAGKLFYRLVYGYVMLLENRPGHPIGMPFPGGWFVYEKQGNIFCPIRDKEKDLPQALCNYCPAVQDPRV